MKMGDVDQHAEQWKSGPQLPLAQTVEAPQTPVQDFSATEAVWLFVRNPSDLDQTEQVTLAAVCQASETAKAIYQLIQEFRQILHHREGEKLDEETIPERGQTACLVEKGLS